MHKPPRDKQCGVVMIVSMVVLMLMSLLATTVYETSLLQLRMAGNEQLKTQARQRSLAIVDAVLSRPEDIPLRGDVGHRICAAGSAQEHCDEAVIVIDDILAAGPGSVDYVVTRQGPLEVTLPPMSEDSASSGRHYRAALFEIRASCKGVDQGGAGSTVAQGVLLRMTVPGSGGG